MAGVNMEAEMFCTELFHCKPDDRLMEILIQWRNIAGVNIPDSGSQYSSTPKDHIKDTAPGSDHGFKKSCY